ncbi:MAG: hypothetical protein QM682_07610 [Paracoccus sp. (in: a-proteobacteria)]|uniref:hypothetical protein n=1 Tax=Paracoccus sp. TaxID=267 RepID=UPI0039E3B812
MPIRGNLYQSLISAAKAHLVDSGVLPGTLDELAQLAGAPAEDVRQSFASMAEVRDGLIYDGVVLLNDALRQAIIQSDPDSPEAQLRALARSYGDWAQENRPLFRLLIDALAEDVAPESAVYRFTLSIRGVFERKLQEMKTLGILAPETDLERIILVLHCLIRGANLVFAGRGTDPWTKGDLRSNGNLAEAIFDEFMNGLIAAHGPRKP